MDVFIKQIILCNCIFNYCLLFYTVNKWFLVLLLINDNFGYKKIFIANPNGILNLINRNEKSVEKSSYY